MSHPNPVLSIQYLLEIAYRDNQTRVFEEELSTRSSNGVEYAAAILYADYLGLRVVGRIPPWVRRLKKYPLSVPEPLRKGVVKILSNQNVLLTDDGNLIARRGIPTMKL